MGKAIEWKHDRSFLDEVCVNSFLFMGKAIEWKRFPNENYGFFRHPSSLWGRRSNGNKWSDIVRGFKPYLPLYGEGDRMETLSEPLVGPEKYHLPLYGEGDRMETSPETTTPLLLSGPSSLWGRRSNGNNTKQMLDVVDWSFLFMGKAIEWKRE